MSEQEQEVESVEESSDVVEEHDTSNAGEPDEIVDPEPAEEDDESSEDESSEHAPVGDEDSDELDDLFLSPDEESEGVIEVDVVAEAEASEDDDSDAGEDNSSAELDAVNEAHEEERANLEQRIEELEEQVETAREENEKTRERMMRSVADLENFRKRSKREREELRKYGIDKLSLELIPAVDNLERALAHAEASEEESNILDGVKMVYKQIIAALQKHGVTGFDATGEQFNPEHHEAIQQVETQEHENGEVVEQFQKGYMIHDRLLRPALVSVAKRVEGGDNEDQSSDTEDADEASEDALEGESSAEESEATQE